ncbi:hypothetical protein HP532_15040 [Pseudomonas sp. CrR25]|nr:hypothetical protein [Pseudomonas sp. CrR25]
MNAARFSVIPIAFIPERWRIVRDRPGGGEMLEVTGLGSNAGQMFSALDSEIPHDSPDAPKAIRVAGEYGVTFQI